MTHYLIQGWFPKYETFGKHCERLAVFPPDLRKGPTVAYDRCRFLQDAGYPLYEDSTQRGCILFNQALEVDTEERTPEEGYDRYTAKRCPFCLAGDGE